MAELIGVFAGFVQFIALAVLFTIVCGIFVRLGHTNALLAEIANHAAGVTARPTAISVSSTETQPAELPLRGISRGGRWVAILAVVAVLGLLTVLSLIHAR